MANVLAMRLCGDFHHYARYEAVVATPSEREGRRGPRPSPRSPSDTANGLKRDTSEPLSGSNKPSPANKPSSEVKTQNQKKPSKEKKYHQIRDGLGNVIQPSEYHKAVPLIISGGGGAFTHSAPYPS